MLRAVRILLLILPFLVACGTEQKSATDQRETTKLSNLKVDTTPTSEDFRAAFNKFFEALQTSDTGAFNQLIHPKHGLWIIEQPGALPKMTQIFKIQNFGREYQNRSFFTVAEEMKSCDLSEEPLPSFDCADMNYDKGTTGYSKDGCFVWNADKFRKTNYWDYASLTDTELQRVKASLPHVQKTVLHTNTSFEFHFGQLNGQWHLLFAKIIYPCSA